MAGRRPTPTELKLVRGNPGKRPINKKEPQPARRIPSAPAHLASEGQVAWGRLTVLLDRMGVLTEADGFALERLCDCYAEILALREIIAAQALIFMITNSGSNKRGPCWEYHEYGSKVASGALVDDGFFAYICSLDEGDDPIQDESCWFKSNPSLQDADLPGMKYLREQVTEARGMPSKEAMVRRLNFCEWTGAESPWISWDVWSQAEERVPKLLLNYRGKDGMSVSM